MDRKKITSKILLVFLLVILAGLQVLILNKYSTSGGRLTFLASEISKTEAENSRLGKEVASSAAIMTISAKAQNLGLLGTSSTFSLSSPLTVAKFSDFSL